MSQPARGPSGFARNPREHTWQALDTSTPGCRPSSGSTTPTCPQNHEMKHHNRACAAGLLGARDTEGGQHSVPAPRAEGSRADKQNRARQSRRNVPRENPEKQAGPSRACSLPLRAAPARPACPRSSLTACAETSVCSTAWPAPREKPLLPCLVRARGGQWGQPPPKETGNICLQRPLITHFEHVRFGVSAQGRPPTPHTGNSLTQSHCNPLRQHHDQTSPVAGGRDSPGTLTPKDPQTTGRGGLGEAGLRKACERTRRSVNAARRTHGQPCSGPGVLPAGRGGVRRQQSDTGVQSRKHSCPWARTSGPCKSTRSPATRARTLEAALLQRPRLPPPQGDPGLLRVPDAQRVPASGEHVYARNRDAHPPRTCIQKKSRLDPALNLST